MGHYLAIDMGAESGRLVLGNIKDEKIETRELFRYKTQGVEIHGKLYWNLIRFYEEILNGFRENGKILSSVDLQGIGIDTWGVDFVILDERDNLAHMPYHYREKTMNAMLPELLKTIPRDEIYAVTGIQFMSLNSNVKLYGMMKEKQDCIKNGKTFLMVPDYFNFLLTGEKACEYTDATTTQLMNAIEKDWHVPFLEKIGVNKEMFSTPEMPCKVLGQVVPTVYDKNPFLEGVPVHLIGSHDTASAVVGCPLKTKNSAYLSSGTWSLLGMEIEKPILGKQALEKNFTNEGGVESTIRFLKNIMGLWLLQQSKLNWELKNDVKLDYEGIVNAARKHESFGSLIYPDDTRFLNPPSMLDEIRGMCKDTGQDIPAKFGEFATIIFKSLALRYKQVLDDLETLTGKSIDCLNIVGGGSRNALLCQYAANAINREVLAGPDEGTSIGNIIVQAISNGELKNVEAGRKIINNSFPLKKYEPIENEKWNQLYDEKYLPLFIEK
ncbi:MAG: rhamnulokinase family protein [Candidatus Hodarchaeota archaeon]